MEIFKITHANYEGNCIWCTAFCDPYLYKIDIENRNIEQVVAVLDENEELGAYLFTLSYKNYFIFIQSNTKKIIVMNRDNFEKEIYKIPYFDTPERRISYKMVNSFIFEDNLYIFGLEYNGIIKFNLQTKKFSQIDDYLNNLDVTYHNELICNYSYIQVEDSFFLPFANTNAVLEFLPNADDKTIIHYVGDKNQRYTASAFDGENIWLTPRDCLKGDIVKWNPMTNAVKQYSNYFSEEQLIGKNLLDYTLKIGKYILMLSMSMHNRYNIKINIENDEISCFEDFFDDYVGLGHKYSCLHSENGMIYFIFDLNLIKYDLQEEKVETIPLKPNWDIKKYNEKRSREKLDFIFRPYRNGNSFTMYENKFYNLQLLLNFLR